MRLTDLTVILVKSETESSGISAQGIEGTQAYMPQLTNEIILAAIAGFEQQKKHVDEEIARLRAMLSGGRTAASAETPRRRRKLSAEARRRMRDAQRARWARVRGESAGSAKAKPSTRTKRRLSEAGRQAIIAATKRRWRLQKAGGKKAQAATAGKAASKKAKRASRKASATPAQAAGGNTTQP